MINTFIQPAIVHGAFGWLYVFIMLLVVVIRIIGEIKKQPINLFIVAPNL